MYTGILYTVQNLKTDLMARSKATATEESFRYCSINIHITKRIPRSFQLIQLISLAFLVCILVLMGFFLDLLLSILILFEH